MTSIQALPTEYAGILFRSRLEARWAMFFDLMDIKWQYEPEGFQVPYFLEEGDNWYLPDFYLPGLDIWAEVKGRITERDTNIIMGCVDFGGCLPMKNVEDSSRLALLGEIPRIDWDDSSLENFPVHTLFFHSKVAVFLQFMFIRGGLFIPGSLNPVDWKNFNAYDHSYGGDIHQWGKDWNSPSTSWVGWDYLLNPGMGRVGDYRDELDDDLMGRLAATPVVFRHVRSHRFTS